MHLRLLRASRVLQAVTCLMAIGCLTSVAAGEVTVMATDDVVTNGPGDGTFGDAFQSGVFVKDEYQVDGAGAATGLNSLAGGGDPKWRTGAVQFDLTGYTAGDIPAAHLVMDLRDNRSAPGEVSGPVTVRIRMLADSEDGWVDDTVAGSVFTPLVSLADGSVEVEVEALGEYAWDVTSMVKGPNGIGLNPIVGFMVDTTTPVVDKIFFQDLENTRGFGEEFLGPHLNIVPEPSTTLLLLVGALGTVLFRRHKRPRVWNL